jgi:hypothetical protein
MLVQIHSFMSVMSEYASLVMSFLLKHLSYVVCVKTFCNVYQLLNYKGNNIDGLQCWKHNLLPFSCCSSPI